MNRALAIQPAAAFHANHGAVRHSRKDFAGAVASYDRALSADPSLAWAYLFRGNARFHLGTPGGCDDYERAFGLDPRLAARLAARALLRALDSGATRLLEECENDLRNDSADAMTYAHRGLVLLRLGRCREAAQDFARFEAHYPEWAGFLRLVAGHVASGRDPQLRCRSGRNPDPSFRSQQILIPDSGDAVPNFRLNR